MVLHSPELAEAIEAIEVDPSKVSLSSDQRYLCRAMKTKLPLLPVHGVAECRLFQSLITNHSISLDFDAMAFEWCKHVDGVNIFPKLPVYLRTYHTKWQKNQRVRDAVECAKAGKAVLEVLNTQTAPAAPPPPATPPQPDDCANSPPAAEAAEHTAPPLLRLLPTVPVAMVAAASPSISTCSATALARPAGAAHRIEVPPPPAGLVPPGPRRCTAALLAASPSMAT